jgi:Kef-type K+ transport system membrane component KefB
MRTLAALLGTAIATGLPGDASGMAGPGFAPPVAPHAAGAVVMPVLIALVLVLLGARLGASLAGRLRQPPVLGELLAGVVIGNLGLFGWHGCEGLRDLAGLEVLAQLGVLLLLFDVGLESEVRRMLAVGPSSLLVATLGVLAPIGLGAIVSRALLPGLGPLTHWFVGATLCATSVGITARVLGDLGFVDRREGRIILGAAVIDDVLGLVVLAVIAAVIADSARGVPFHPGVALVILAKAAGFLAVAFLVGHVVSRRLFGLAARLPGSGPLLSLALAFCFALAWLAGLLGLAPIVGAFAAGLVLEEGRGGDAGSGAREPRDIASLLEPLKTFLVPVFFVLMGMRVDLSVFATPGTLGFAGALIVVAVLSKQACSLGVLERDTDRLAVGLGMIPRGEVGLIFASLGTALTLGGERVVSPMVFSAIVAMVVVTTFLTPPLLAWRLRKLPAEAGRPGEGP